MSTDIVLIDDNEIHLQTTGRILQNYGFSVATLSNPVQSLNILPDIHPRIIVLDIMMPGMDGFHLLKSIKELPDFQEIPIIILSGKQFAPDKRKALSLGAKEYLTKPVNSRDLISEIKKYL